MPRPLSLLALPACPQAGPGEDGERAEEWRAAFAPAARERPR